MHTFFTSILIRPHTPFVRFNWLLSFPLIGHAAVLVEFVPNPRTPNWRKIKVLLKLTQLFGQWQGESLRGCIDQNRTRFKLPFRRTWIDPRSPVWPAARAKPFRVRLWKGRVWQACSCGNCCIFVHLLSVTRKNEKERRKTVEKLPRNTKNGQKRELFGN